MKHCFITLICILLLLPAFAQKSVRVAVAGLSHGHVDWIFNRPAKSDILLVGIYEPDQELAERYAERYKLDKNLFFDDLAKMLDRVKPAAVSAFGATSEHITVVRACAPRKIHVMVEKPLATTFADAKEIQALALKNGIQVLTNFETSWYASNQYVEKLVRGGE